MLRYKGLTPEYSMSLFLNSEGCPTTEVEDVFYVLIGATKQGTKIYTSDLMTCLEQIGNDKQMIRIYGENVYSIPVSYKNVTYWYVTLSEVTRLQSKVSGYIGGMLTGNIRGLLQLGSNSYYDEVESYGLAEINRLTSFRYDYKLDKQKEVISQNHHYHVRLIDLYKRCDNLIVNGAEAVLCMYLDRFNDVEATHATFITYFRTVNDRVKNIFFGMIRMNMGIDMTWLKEEGKAAKQSSVLTTATLSQLYEINVLVNRLDIMVNWEEEKSNRVSPDLTDVAEHSIYNHAITLFSMARQAGKKPVKMDFNEYWSQRAVAMPAGAIHDEDEYFRSVIKGLPREVKNKKGFASALPNFKHDYFLNKKKIINSYTSTKYEWGKTRALYGCDFTSHVHADFGLLACEETFPYFIPTGDAANANYISNVMRPYNSYIPVCYDYEDFNSQHSFSGMKAVLRAWLRVYKELLTEEQQDSVLWTIDSIGNQKVHNSQENDEYSTAGTLFSGWRLTSFMNTALNYCYLAEAGINKLTGLHMHNGDDVFATVNSLDEAVKLYSQAKKLGIRANMTKMSIGTIAEFLRTDMRSKEASSRQYLARGVSTFTHSRIESSAPMTYRNLVEAYTTRFREVTERGGDRQALVRLYKKQLFFARQLFDVEEEIQEKLLTYSPIAGGICEDGIIRDDELYEVEMVSKTLTEYDIPKLVSSGVRDYTTYLSQKFPAFRNKITTNKVLDSILSGYNIKKKTLRVRSANTDVLVRKRAMRGAWLKMKGIALLNRVRMGVSNIIVVLQSISSGHAEAISKADDPIAWLALLLKR